MTDQPGWHGVEDLAQQETARGGDAHRDLLIIRGPPGGQRLEAGPFDVDALGIAGVDPADDLVDETAVGRRSSKSRDPRMTSASSMARFRWPWGPSMEPFSCATPLLLREGVMP